MLADEISNAISSGPHTGEQIDEDELAAELDQMEQEEVDNKMLDAGPLPTAPRTAACKICRSSTLPLWTLTASSEDYTGSS